MDFTLKKTNLIIYRINFNFRLHSYKQQVCQQYNKLPYKKWPTFLHCVQPVQLALGNPWADHLSRSSLDRAVPMCSCGHLEEEKFQIVILIPQLGDGGRTDSLFPNGLQLDLKKNSRK